MNRIHAAAIALLLLAGCASPGYNGGGLVAGQSTAQDVQARMGKPTEQVKAADGDTVWFYTRQPFGRQMYAVRVAPDGRVRSVEQTLTEENLGKLVPGSTNQAAAREIIGPPYMVSSNPRMQRDIWEYTMFNLTQWDYFLYLQFSPDGILREALMIKDYSKEVGAAKD